MTTTPILTINGDGIWKASIGICDRMPDFAREVGQDQILVLMKHGSHLYGTNGPDSDLDIKGVFMPTAAQVALGKIPKAYSYTSKKSTCDKNTSKDIDIQLFSLHYFVELACQGETLSIDMLHARKEQCIVWTPLWEELFEMRSYFYTQDMKAFVGYARTQAAKYGIKGSRIDAIALVLKFLDSIAASDPDAWQLRKLKDVWASLPTGEHIHFLDPNPRDKNGNKIYQVCGRQFLESTPTNVAFECLRKIYDNYGERAKLAKENKGIDWKAVSHAFRAAFQLEEIFETGDLRFPLADALFINHTKHGKRDWNVVQYELETAIKRVEGLSEASLFPQKADRAPIDSWLKMSVYGMIHTMIERALHA